MQFGMLCKSIPSWKKIAKFAGTVCPFAALCHFHTCSRITEVQFMLTLLSQIFPAYHTIKSASNLKFTEKHAAEFSNKSNRKAMNRNWSNQKANPALKTKTGNK